MNIPRRLGAPPNPLLQAYTAATGRTVQDAVGDNTTTGTPAAWMSAPEYPEIWAALAGVTDHGTPRLPAPTAPQERP